MFLDEILKVVIGKEVSVYHGFKSELDHENYTLIRFDQRNDSQPEVSTLSTEKARFPLINILVKKGGNSLPESLYNILD